MRLLRKPETAEESMARAAGCIMVGLAVLAALTAWAIYEVAAWALS